jgi:hypothetical protein
MTTEDLDKAVRISKEYGEIYDKLIGLVSISKYVHLSFDAFVDLFEEFDIGEHGDSDEYFQLSTRYDGVKIISLADYKEMLSNPKTKKYLEELTND